MIQYPDYSHYDTVLQSILANEGGYTNNPNDAGGETNYGITATVARANGYDGAMRDLPLQFAKMVYFRRYITDPGFDKIYDLSKSIGAELIDTGVNMGPAVAARFIQRALNLFNLQGKRYAEITVDGNLGPATMAAFQGFLAFRGSEGVGVLLKTLNILQGFRYIELAEAKQSQEEFIYGWIRTRVVI